MPKSPRAQSAMSIAKLLGANLRSDIPRFVRAAQAEISARTKGLRTTRDICDALEISERAYRGWLGEGLVEPTEEQPSTAELIRRFVLEHPEGVTPEQVVDSVQEHRPEVRTDSIRQLLSKEFRAGNLRRTGIGGRWNQSRYFPPKPTGKSAQNH